MQIYFDNTLIDEDYYSNLSTNFALFDTSFMLGSTASNKYSLSIAKEGVAVQPTFVNILEGTDLVASLVVDNMEEDDFFYKYELTDRMVELDIPYDASAIFEDGSTTLLKIAQDICSIISTELATTNFNGYDKVITWYDTRITAREYLGYIAELNGGYAQIGKDGKMYFLKQKQESAKTIEIDDCADYEIGERHKISRVVYQLGALKYEFGDETYDTLYLNPNNVFITEETDVENIYNDINGFEFYSFKTSNCPIDFNIYAGQIITFTDGVNNYPTIAGYNLQYYGGWFGGYELNVNTNKQEETKIIDDSERIKALNIIVNRDENILLATVEQTQNNTSQISTQQQTIDSISNSISLIGGNNKQKNSIGAYGTEDYEQSEAGHILAYEDETLKTVTDNGFGRIIYLTDEKWFKFKSDSLVIGDTYTLSFKYSNDEDNHCVIDFINNNTTNLVDTLEEKTLEAVEYTFTANTEFVELYVSTGEVGRVGITDYYLQTGDIATKWQPASGEALSTTLAIYYDGIEVTSGSSEIITNISNLGFTVKNTNGKILITFNKDRCIMNDAEINGTFYQGTWLRYTQNINGYNHLLEVEI